MTGDRSVGSGTDRAVTADDPAYDTVAATVRSADAGAFVHVGDRFDSAMRYLTRFAGPDRPYAFVCVVTPDDVATTLCAPSLFGEQARREFPGETVRTANVGQPPGKRAATVLADADATDPVLVPPSIPHAAVARLESAGWEVHATDAVSTARRRKPESRIDRHRTVQRAATRGMAAMENALSEATVRASDGVVTLAGERLTTERLRRIGNAAMARAGVRPAGNTVVGSGETAADLHYTGTDTVRAGETVLIDLSPRGPTGAYADLTRTFAVEPDGGWERRAYVAVESAREAALTTVTDGVAAGTVHEETTAELAAHGFRVDSSSVGFVHSTGHGVGFALHEPPTVAGGTASGTGEETSLEAGDVVTIEPGVYDPEIGGVRLEDTIVVRDDGYDVLASYPFSLRPSERDPAAFADAEPF